MKTLFWSLVLLSQVQPGPVWTGSSAPQRNPYGPVDMDDGGQGTADPYWRLMTLADFLDTAEEELTATGVGEPFGVSMRLSEPTVQSGLPISSAFAFVTLSVPGADIGSGELSIVANSDTGVVNFRMEIVEFDAVRILDLDVTLSGGVLLEWGTLSVDTGATTTTYSGGWVYTHADGLSTHPDSDEGFHDEAAVMFHVILPEPERKGRSLRAPPLLSTIFAHIGNIASHLVVSIIDAFRPYTAPTSCSGPIVYNGAGQSCENAFPCLTILEDLCLKIDEIPDVSVAFKKCMKGRCGCGGSSHRRLRISCDDASDCGSCGSVPGCSNFGATIWYCENNNLECRCAGIVFHEMTHSCGIGHSLEYTLNPDCDIPNDSACQIGEMFEDECIAASPNFEEP
ncbi:MAG: hypothetical protein AABZ47_08820 [Planctomycetota bacterium]